MSSRYDTGDYHVTIPTSNSHPNYANYGSGGKREDCPSFLCFCGQPAEKGFRSCTRCETNARIIAHLNPGERIKLARGARTLFPTTP